MSFSSKEIVFIAKEYEAKQKAITMMTRDSLNEKNLVTGESKKLTDHVKEVQLNKSSNEPNEFNTKHRRKPRMQFKDGKISNPLLHKSIDKVNKAENKLDKEIDKLLRRYMMHKQIIYDKSLKKSKSRLKFEEVDVSVNKSRRARYPTRAITSTADNALYAKICEVEKNKFDEDRCLNVQKMEEDFYKDSTEEKVDNSTEMLLNALRKLSADDRTRLLKELG